VSCKPPSESESVIGPKFEIETVECEPHAHLAVRGEIDIKTAPELERVLSGSDSEMVVVDLSGVSFIDSSGLRVLVMARTQLESNGGNLVLCAPDDSPIVRTIRLAGLASDFRVVANTDSLSE
jgi:anti-sigma B factor antagonist